MAPTPQIINLRGRTAKYLAETNASAGANANATPIIPPWHTRLITKIIKAFKRAQRKSEDVQSREPRQNEEQESIYSVRTMSFHTEDGW